MNVDLSINCSNEEEFRMIEWFSLVRALSRSLFRSSRVDGEKILTNFELKLGETMKTI